MLVGHFKTPHTSVLLSGIYSLRWLLLFAFHSPGWYRKEFVSLWEGPCPSLHWGHSPGCLALRSELVWAPTVTETTACFLLCGCDNLAPRWQHVTPPGPGVMGHLGDFSHLLILGALSFLSLSSSSALVDLVLLFNLHALGTHGEIVFGLSELLVFATGAWIFHTLFRSRAPWTPMDPRALPALGWASLEFPDSGSSGEIILVCLLRACLISCIECLWAPFTLWTVTAQIQPCLPIPSLQVLNPVSVCFPVVICH